MNYFRNLPKIYYDIKGTANPYYTEAVNIMVKQKIRQAVKDDIATYYPYRIEDGQRPDILAELYYGNSSYYWLIFIMNDIKDPYYDWPMDFLTWETYINEKYGSTDTAQTAVHEYYQIIRSERTNDTMVDDELAISPEVRYTIDFTTYDALDSGDRGIVYKYNWEFDMNEAKRNIKLVDSVYAGQLIKEAGKAFI